MSGWRSLLPGGNIDHTVRAGILACIAERISEHLVIPLLIAQENVSPALMLIVIASEIPPFVETFSSARSLL